MILDFNLLSFHLFYQQMENYCLIICLFESFPYCLLFERKIHFPEGITISCLVERTQVHLRLDDGNGFGYSFLLNTKNITFCAE